MDEAQIIKLMDKLSEMSERLARVETMLQANASEYKHINDTLIDHDRGWIYLSKPRHQRCQSRNSSHGRWRSVLLCGGC